MNGPPPSVPASPPPSPAPVPPQQIVLPRQGIGCFGMGCLTLLMVGFLFIVGVIGSTWYLFTKAADVFTSSEPADLRIVKPDPAQIRAAEGSVSRLKTAIANNQETTVGFTAADLNALVDRDPDFEDLRGRIRIDIANSVMSVTMSTALDELPWKRLRGRWLNASASFKFDYDSGMFDVDIRHLEANGHEMSDTFLSGFASSFNEAFTSKFHDEVRENDLSEFWDHVKRITLEDDKLVVTTEAK